MMTEADAKTKWCPFSRSWTEHGSANRDYNGELRGADKCIGSACMAWRRGDTWGPDDMLMGFCGLAGRAGA